MPTINVTLPIATVNVRYNEAVTLTGTGPFKLGKYDLPVGLEAKVIGNQLIINGTVTEAYVNYEAVFEILTGCPECVATIIVGAMGGSAGATSCTCVVVTIPPVVLPAAIYGEEYYALIPLQGSGPFEMCGGSVPFCLKAEIVGRMVRISGQIKVRQTPLEVRFSVKNSCTCDCVDFIGSISVTGQPGCTYCFTMQPTIAVVGSVVRTNVRFPEGCESDDQLVLDAFMTDGVTRYMLPGITPPVPLSIYLPQGDSEYTIQETDVNQHVIFKPRLLQTACLAGCTPCVPYVERYVPNFKDPCAIFWSILATRFTAETPQLQEYSAFNIPPGCAVVFDWYEGNTLVQAGAFVLSAENPVYNPGLLKFPSVVVGLDYNFRPKLPLAGSCFTRTCFIKPDRIDFDVVAAGVCAVNWDISTKSFFAGVPANQTVSATGLPANCAIKFDLYLGNVLQDFGSVTLTALNPAVTNSALNFPPATVGLDYNYRPVLPLVGACLPCSVSPSRVDFEILASSGCVVQWDLFPSPVVVGQSSGIRILSGPLNCSVSFQAYQADGVTIIPGAVITILTNASGTGASAQGACTSAGTAVWKPVSPQSAACALACVFGVASFTHVCGTGSSPPPPSSSTNLCVGGTFEGGSSATFPITWRNSSIVAEYNQANTTGFTNTTPLIVRASIPFTILPGSTSLGATSMPFIVETPGAGASAIAVNASISRNRCAFTPAAGVTYLLGSLNSHSNTFSVNDASLAGGGEFNLTTGQWYYNIELPSGLPANYNYNRLLDFHWYA